MTNGPRNAFYSDRSPPRYFSIDQGRPFLADLARGLIDAFGEALPRAEIWLPTRRAVRALAGAILDVRAGDGAAAALLPRMRAIGDIDDGDTAAFAGDAADEIELPPAISPMARTLELARLVAARDRAFAGQENWPGALAAARELGKLLDSLYAEEIDPAAISRIDVGDRARHWDVSRAFLEIVTAAWPVFLEARGLSDPADRRSRLIGAKARRIAAAPPAHPLVIAGTTASAPSVARLVAAIAAAPLGAAVLPGLDRDLDGRAFEVMDDAHPQSGLKALLKAIGQAPADIAPWPGAGGARPRAALLRLALRPAEATDEWLPRIAGATAADPRLASATDGFSLIEAETEDAEALIVAMIFRQTLERQAATAMLVTPDRTLARRVALKMRRWGVIVDDSGGVPFANTACGTFLRLVAGFLADPGDPVALLALLRHPLARLGLEDADRSRGVDALDRALRGPRPAIGLEGVAGRLQERPDRSDAAVAVLGVLTGASRPIDGDAARLSDRLRAHLAAAETIAGGVSLWSGDDGAAGAELLAEILGDETTLNGVGDGAYGDIFEALIAGAVVRRRSDAHPRLSILGPLEARLLSADHVILGGLNEGVWPQGAPADPFLSREMRLAIGLPAPERRIGLAAHDFAQGAASPVVTLTRAKRSGGKPAKPSRWIVRLKNILKGAGALDACDRSALWSARAERLDAPENVIPVEAPAPRAGKDRRPARLSVTDIETWIRDPYAIYARRLLNLRKLEEPGAALGARDAGSLLHRVFERAGKAPAALPAAALNAILDEEALRAGLTGADRAFWSASLEEALAWFQSFDAARRLDGAAHVETAGALTLGGVDPPFTLTARADRIDALTGGGAAIFDFKTGELPTEKQEKASFSPQLPLTGVILEAGGFATLGPLRAALYRYLKIANRSDDDAKNVFGAEGEAAAAAIRQAEADLRRWIAHFDDPEAIYRSQPRPQFVKREGDYDQLARRREWSASDDAEGGGE